MERLLLSAMVFALGACCKLPGSGTGDAPAPTTTATTLTTVATSTTPAPIPTAAPELGPDGLPVNIPTARTPAPSVAEWNTAILLQVPSAVPQRCEVNMIREWVRVNCTGKRRSGGSPNGIKILGGCTQDTYTSMRSNSNLVTAISQGRRCEVEFSWTDGKEVFVAEWIRGKRPALGFQPAPPPAPSASAPMRILRLPTLRK